MVATLKIKKIRLKIIQNMKDCLIDFERFWAKRPEKRNEEYDKTRNIIIGRCAQNQEKIRLKIIQNMKDCLIDFERFWAKRPEKEMRNRIELGV